MKFFSGEATNASLPGLWVIFRYVRGHDTVTEDQLKDAVAPTALVTSAESVLPACLAVAKGMGLLSVRQGGRALGPTAALLSMPSRALDDPSAFAAWFRRLLRRRAIEECEESGSMSDLAASLCWIGTQDPFEPLPWGFQAATARAIRDLDPGVANDTQFRAFRRWLVQLGYVRGVPHSGGKLLGVTYWRVLAAELPVTDKALTGQAFTQRLLDRVPELPGGELFERFAPHLAEEYRQQQLTHRVMALALQQMQAQGLLRLVESADAAGEDRFSARAGGSTIVIDQVRVTEAGANYAVE